MLCYTILIILLTTLPQFYITLQVTEGANSARSSYRLLSEVQAYTIF